MAKQTLATSTLGFAGPFRGKTYLLVTDANSKWPEIVEMRSTTADRTIEELRKMFSSYGLPEQIVSDNDPQFVAEEFASFVKANGIKHIKSEPFWNCRKTSSEIQEINEGKCT